MATNGACNLVFHSAADSSEMGGFFHKPHGPDARATHALHRVDVV